MTDQLLDIFKYALLALLYLFFARVLWAVWSEVRGPRLGKASVASTPVTASPRNVAAPSDPTSQVAMPAPTAATAPAVVRQKTSGKRGAVSRLVISQPRSRRGAAFALGQEISIGRTNACTIMIPDDTFVSQVHARVYVLNGEAWAEDLGSTNGSYLNGKRLNAPHPLVKGDRLQIGNTIFEAE